MMNPIVVTTHEGNKKYSPQKQPKLIVNIPTTKNIFPPAIGLPSLTFRLQLFDGPSERNRFFFIYFFFIIIICRLCFAKIFFFFLLCSIWIFLLFSYCDCTHRLGFVTMRDFGLRWCKIVNNLKIYILHNLTVLLTELMRWVANKQMIPARSSVRN